MVVCWWCGHFMLSNQAAELKNIEWICKKKKKKKKKKKLEG